MLDTPAFASEEATIDEFKVSSDDGSLSSVGSLAVPEICPEVGNRLFVFDSGGPGSARLFSETCNSMGKPGVRVLSVNESTGALSDKGTIFFGEIGSFRVMGIAGEEIGFAGNSATQTQLEFGYIDPSTGEPSFPGLPFGLTYGTTPSEVQHGHVVAVDPGLFSIANVSPLSASDHSAGIATYPFGGGGGVAQAQPELVSALGFTPTALIAGEYEGDTRLAIFGKGQVAAGSGVIDLGQPPTNISPGSGIDPNFPETVYSLGSFVYVGIYGNRSVELLSEPEQAVQLMPEPFVKGNGTVEPDPSTNSFAGFLTGSPTGPGEPGGGGGPGGGGAGGGSGGGGAGPKPIGLTAGAVARLGSGVVRVSVDCGLPCKVAGSLIPPGAKAQSAHGAAGLPFKPVSLPGTGQTVAVKLKFTHAQKKLAASLLAHHKKVKAQVMVTEAPGGAPPRSATIKVV